MSTIFCPTCHQPVAEVRAGVRLSPLKARIFDAIARTGIDGILTDDVNAVVFNGERNAATVKAHIWQINELLAETDVRIRSIGGYYVVTERRKANVRTS